MQSPINNPVLSFNIVGELEYEDKLRDIMSNYGITTFLYKKQLGYNISKDTMVDDNEKLSKEMEITIKTDIGSPVLADPRRLLNSGESLLSQTIDTQNTMGGRSIDPMDPRVGINGKFNVVAMQLKQLKAQLSELERRQATEIEGGRVYTSGVKIDPINGHSNNINNSNNNHINSGDPNLGSALMLGDENRNENGYGSSVANDVRALSNYRANTILRSNYDVHSPESYNALNLNPNALNTLSPSLTPYKASASAAGNGGADSLFFGSALGPDGPNSTVNNNGKLRIRIKPMEEGASVSQQVTGNGINNNNDNNNDSDNNNSGINEDKKKKDFVQPKPHDPTGDVEGPFVMENGIEYYCDENGNPFYLDEDGEPYYKDENGRDFIVDDNGVCVYLREEDKKAIQEEQEMEELYTVTTEYLKETYPDLEESDIKDIIDEIRRQETTQEKKEMIEKLLESDGTE